jgi:hypothetical protein
MGRACSPYGGEQRRIQGLVGKPEGKRPLGRPRRRWEDNIKMELQELGYGGMDWIEMARVRNKCWALVNAVMNLRVPYNEGNFLTSWKPVGSNPPLQEVKSTQGQKPAHHCEKNRRHTRKTKTEQDDTNLVTGYRVTLTEKDQVDTPPPPRKHD